MISTPVFGYELFVARPEFSRRPQKLSSKSYSPVTCVGDAGSVAVGMTAISFTFTD
jgi:hypothetical protein